jgi:tetratricopeptide (TPR) repeat protein
MNLLQTNGRSEARSAFPCRKTIWLLVLAMVGCAAPTGSKLSRRLDPQKPRADQAQPLAAASDMDPRRDEMQFQLAEARWRRNDLAACQQSLEEIVSRNPGHRGAHLRLAELYLLRNQSYQALSLMRRFCRTNREDAEAHHLLGLAYEAIGQNDRALAAYDVAASLDPEDPILRRSLEDAVAAREAPGPDADTSRRTLLAGRPAGGDVDRKHSEAPPSRAPQLGVAYAADDEPKRLDHAATQQAASDKSRPRIEIVPIQVPGKNGADAEETSDETEPYGSGNLPGDDFADADDGQPPGPGVPGKSAVRWAYELEAGQVKPAAKKDVEEDLEAPQQGEAPLTETPDLWDPRE